MARAKALDVHDNGRQALITTEPSFMGADKSSYAINRIPAWEMLGQDATDALTAAQALSLAGLDTPVTKQPCFAYLNGEYVEVENRWVTGSPDPSSGLWRPHGVVGDNYEVVQNTEQFEMLDAICDDSGAKYQTAGSVNNGSVVFVAMKLPNTLQFNGGEDNIDLYLYAQNSHDGSKAFTIAITPVRLVCTNKMAAAIKNARSVYKIKHTKNAQLRVQEARQTLNLTFTYVEQFEQHVQQLIDKPMQTKQFEKFAKSFIGYDPEVGTDAKRTRQENTLEQLMELWNAPTQQVAGRNAWAGYNAVTEYIDWFSGTRKKKAADDTQARAMRIMSGKAESQKEAAFARLLAL